MEASAPVIVGLLVGSLTLTCILSLCVAKVFGKKKNEKDPETDESDVDSPGGARKAPVAPRAVPNTVFKPTALTVALPSYQTGNVHSGNFPRSNGYSIINEVSSSNTSGSSLSPISSISRSHIVPIANLQAGSYHKNGVPVPNRSARTSNKDPQMRRYQSTLSAAPPRRKPMYKSVPHKGALRSQQHVITRPGFQNSGYLYA